jgi:hypothetical protein
MQIEPQEDNLEFDSPLIEKDLTRQDRMSRSDAARTKRRTLKAVRETVQQNEYAKLRRAKKKK